VAIAQVIAVIYQDRPLRQFKNRLGTIMNSFIASESSEDSDKSSTSSDSVNADKSLINVMNYSIIIYQLIHLDWSFRHYSAYDFSVESNVCV
jgi:hypothetical protein